MSYQVKGRIIRTDTEDGVKGLIVKAWDVDVGFDDYLGEDTTNENGNFEFSFEQADVGGWFEGRPEIQIRVFDRWENQIYISEKNRVATGATDLGDIKITPELIGDYILSGRIIRTDTELGVVGLSVKVEDVDLLFHDPLGEVLTKEDGFFELDFMNVDFGGQYSAEGAPEICLHVLEFGSTTILYTHNHWDFSFQESATITNVGDLEIAPEPIEPKPIEPMPQQPPLEEVIVDESTSEFASQPLYIANRITREAHKSDCFWVTQMKDSNKVSCSSLKEMAELIKDGGYNGCFYCLPRYDRDTLTAKEILANLEEDLGY